MPSVSVVMPVGGVDEHLAHQLDALVGQDLDSPWELVISMNSPDAAERSLLEALLRDRPGLDARVVDSSSVRSASHARNVGAAAATGDLLAFCDGDDEVEPDWLAHLVVALESADAVGGHLAEKRLAVPGQETWRPPATPGALPTFLGHPFLVTANMGIRRELFEQTGGFDVELIRGEDIALSWDLLRLDATLAYAPDAVVHYRHRRGMRSMMHQHYLYGRGFSQLLARKGLPDGGGAVTGVRSLRPNGQKSATKNVAYFARRGSIAAGRIVGMLSERLASRRGGRSEPTP